MKNVGEMNIFSWILLTIIFSKSYPPNSYRITSLGKLIMFIVLPDHANPLDFGAKRTFDCRLIDKLTLRKVPKVFGFRHLDSSVSNYLIFVIWHYLNFNIKIIFENFLITSLIECNFFTKSNRNPHYVSHVHNIIAHQNYGF